MFSMRCESSYCWHNSLVLIVFFCRCVSYGVLPHDEAERLYDIVSERKRSNRMPGGAMQSPAKPSKKAPTKKVKKARLSSEEGFDPDMQVSSGDAVGRGSL
jgi:hypothetical protein